MLLPLVCIVPVTSGIFFHPHGRTHPTVFKREILKFNIYILVVVRRRLGCLGIVRMTAREHEKLRIITRRLLKKLLMVRRARPPSGTCTTLLRTFLNLFMEMLLYQQQQVLSWPLENVFAALDTHSLVVHASQHSKIADEREKKVYRTASFIFTAEQRPW
jgi:hypothetical protein